MHSFYLYLYCQILVVVVVPTRVHRILYETARQIFHVSGLVLVIIKILEQQLGVPIESKTEMDGEKQLKISLDRLEGFRKAWFEGYEKRLSDLKNQREHYKRRRVEAKHSSRKDFLDDLG